MNHFLTSQTMFQWIYGFLKFFFFEFKNRTECRAIKELCKLCVSGFFSCTTFWCSRSKQLKSTRILSPVNSSVFIITRILIPRTSTFCATKTKTKKKNADNFECNEERGKNRNVSQTIGYIISCIIVFADQNILNEYLISLNSVSSCYMWRGTKS